jgi:Putative zinc-finger
MNTCTAPLSFNVIVEYLAGELGEQDENNFELHLFACAECTQVVEQVGALTSVIRETIPPVVRASHLEQLRSSLEVRETLVEAGQSVEAWFTPDIDLLVHALRADVDGINRIDLEVYGVDDEPYMRVEAVPFDARTGLVYVACQRHFRGEADVEDTRFRLVGLDAGVHRMLGEYSVRHHWKFSL